MFSLLLATSAGCGDSGSGEEENPDSPDAAAADEPGFGEPQTLANVGSDGELAMDSDCVYVSLLTTLSCVDRISGEVRTVNQQQTSVFATVVPDGASLFVATLPDGFGPGSSRDLNISRVDPAGGELELLASVFSGAGAGTGIAVDDTQIVFTTGGTAELLAVPKAGGNIVPFGSASGNFGDLALFDGAAYYVNTLSVFRRPLNNPGSDEGERVGSVSSSLEPYLAAGDDAVYVYGGEFDGSEAMLYRLPDQPGGDQVEVVRVPGTHGGFAVSGDTAFILADRDLYAVDLATGDTEQLEQHEPGSFIVEVVADEDAVYWITSDGTVRFASR